jgi:hypothetical protein
MEYAINKFGDATDGVILSHDHQATLCRTCHCLHAPFSKQFKETNYDQATFCGMAPGQIIAHDLSHTEKSITRLYWQQTAVVHLSLQHVSKQLWCDLCGRQDLVGIPYQFTLPYKGRALQVPYFIS